MDAKETRDQTIKDAKCALLLDAARKLFAEKGYWETRVEDVAAAAGFSKASFYNYYPDKEAVFLSLIIREHEGLLVRIDEAIRTQTRFQPALEAVLQHLLRAMNEGHTVFMSAPSPRNVLDLHAGMFKHAELMARAEQMMGRVIESLTSIVGRARAAGEIASPLDDRLLACFTGSLIHGVFQHYRATRATPDLDAAVQWIVAFAARGFEMHQPVTG